MIFLIFYNRSYSGQVENRLNITTGE